MSQAKSNKMGVVQLTILTMVKHDGLRYHHAADKACRSRDNLNYLLAGDSRRLNGTGMGIRKMRYVQP